MKYKFKIELSPYPYFMDCILIVVEREKTWIQDTNNDSITHVGFMQKVAIRIDILAKIIPASSCLQGVPVIGYDTDHSS